MAEQARAEIGAETLDVVADRGYYDGPPGCSVRLGVKRRRFSVGETGDPAQP